MSVATIHDENGKRTIDLAPVESIVRKVEEQLVPRMGKETRPLSADIVTKVRELETDQLKYLSIGLMDLAYRYASVYQSVLNNPDKFKEDHQFFQEVKGSNLELWNQSQQMRDLIEKYFR